MADGGDGTAAMAVDGGGEGAPTAPAGGDGVAGPVVAGGNPPTAGAGGNAAAGSANGGTGTAAAEGQQQQTGNGDGDGTPAAAADTIQALQARLDRIAKDVTAELESLRAQARRASRESALEAAEADNRRLHSGMEPGGSRGAAGALIAGHAGGAEQDQRARGSAAGGSQAAGPTAAGLGSPYQALRDLLHKARGELAAGPSIPQGTAPHGTTSTFAGLIATPPEVATWKDKAAHWEAQANHHSNVNAMLLTNLPSMLMQVAATPAPPQVDRHGDVVMAGPSRPQSALPDSAAMALAAKEMQLIGTVLAGLPVLQQHFTPPQAETWLKEVETRLPTAVDKGATEATFVDVVCANYLQVHMRAAANRLGKLMRMSELREWVRAWFGIQPDLLKREALQRIMKGHIRQGGKQSVQAHHAVFMDAVVQAGMTDPTQLCLYFKNGLLPQLQGLCEADNEGRPFTSLAAMLTFASGKHARLQSQAQEEVQRTLAHRHLPHGYKHAQSRPALGRQHTQARMPGPHKHNNGPAPPHAQVNAAAFHPSHPQAPARHGHQPGQHKGSRQQGDDKGSFHQLTSEQVNLAHAANVCKRCLARARSGDGIHEPRTSGYGFFCKAAKSRPWPADGKVPLPLPAK